MHCPVLRNSLCPLLLVLPLLFQLFFSTQTAFAASDNGWDENIELTGSFTGTFHLNSNTSHLFHVNNATPGDSWSGSITIQNQTTAPMEIALTSITSEIEDLTLFHALNLNLEIGGELIYSGAYGGNQRQVTPYYVVPAGKSIVLDATVAFPAHYGNELLNKSMDSIWTFEALHQGESSVPAMHEYTVYYLDKSTKESILPKKSGYAVFGSEVTEYAPDIEGYQPDAAKKTISIQSRGNKILFFYEPSDQASEPSETESKVPTGAKTGTDVGQSNTISAVYGILTVLCISAGLVTWLRIRAAKRRI